VITGKYSPYMTRRRQRPRFRPFRPVFVLLSPGVIA
jgi:hypothetical protein